MSRPMRVQIPLLQTPAASTSLGVAMYPDLVIAPRTRPENASIPSSSVPVRTFAPALTALLMSSRTTFMGETCATPGNKAPPSKSGAISGLEVD